MIGLAGWRVWERSADKLLRTLWVSQLILSYAWSPAFFGAENPGLALVVIGLLLATILALILRATRSEPLSGALFMPYLAWVAFASVLNFEIWRLN